MTIYADNAATTKMSRTAIDAMLPYMETHYGNPSSLHSVGQEAAEALQDARERIAACALERFVKRHGAKKLAANLGKKKRIAVRS